MGSASEIQWVEARDAVKHPPGMHGAAPTTKNDLAKMLSAEVEKSCSRLMEVSVSSLDWQVDSQMPFQSEANTGTFLGMSFLLQHPGYFSNQNFHKLIWFVASSRSSNNWELELFYIYVICHQRNISRACVGCLREAL